MSNCKSNDFWFMVDFFFFFSILITGISSNRDSLETDKQVLISLKEFLQTQNKVNQGRYSQWNLGTSNPCQWYGITCDDDNNRVTGVSLTQSFISGSIFNNFSSLTALTHLDLSTNTLGGPIPDDLSRCRSLKHLNLSHNIIEDALNLSGFDQLEVIDLSLNRIHGEIQSVFPSLCSSLVVANLSENNFTGGIDKSFERCLRLKYLDLSSNKFSGQLWTGFSRLVEFSVSENMLAGNLTGSVFADDCSLQVLDLSGNRIVGEVPKEISNCRNLTILHLWKNNFTGVIPAEIGTISTLEALFLGDNKFSRNIPETLLSLERLAFLDLSKNGFGGEIQPIFGKFKQVKFLVLHGNSYTNGMVSSGILKLPNVVRLDLSFNNFTGPLPVEISEMESLELLFLAHNQFNGTIPLEYGNFSRLQALDLSFNRLTGSIPLTFGKLSSLLWLMLANNSLAGGIPGELGNCKSLLWLNLANNELSGEIPSELTRIGRDPSETFGWNNRKRERIIAGSGECLAMKRWIPADYPPFSFVYTILTRRSCRSIWDRILRGVGLFPICVNGSNVRTLQVSGYVQLSGNGLTGKVPPAIGDMKSFSMLHLGRNKLSGDLPSQIGDLPLVVLNVSVNRFSGEIPAEIRKLRCLQNLDLSCNNFSGNFPWGISDLTELNKFNISYNPFIAGSVPATGQMTTFDRDSYLGNPLLVLPSFIRNSSDESTKKEKPFPGRASQNFPSLWVFVVLALGLVVSAILSLLVCSAARGSPEPERYGGVFSFEEIARATRDFSERRIIGEGGFGMVYRGILSDGRRVAVKRLQREGAEAEREFRAEMEVLTLRRSHPNLVALYGWCAEGESRVLVYELMEGGSLEEVIADRVRLTWRRRVEVAADVARALVFLHHECSPAVVHRDVKASNVLLDGEGKARVTDFGLARAVGEEQGHVSTAVAGTVGYVAPEYGHTWRATTRGDVYSFGVLAMELATGRRAVAEDGGRGGEECLVEWGRRVAAVGPTEVVGGAEEMCELLRVGIKCTAETPQHRPNMKEVLAMIVSILYSNNIRGK